MNSKKNNMVNSDEDLKFIPLDLKEPFKSKDSSWVPCVNMDIPTNNMTNNFFMGLPNLQSTQGFTALPNMNTNQIPPYSSTFSNPSSLGSNMNLNNNSNMQPNNMQSNFNNNLNPNSNNSNPNNNFNQNNNFNPNNIIDENELYPSEGPENELHSYNTDNNNNPNNMNNNMNTNTNRSIDSLIHLDILRDFDLSLDSDITTDNRDDSNITIDKVFNDIEDNNNGLLSTLKSYRMPYPIATLVIKKIIKVTLDHSNKE